MKNYTGHEIGFPLDKWIDTKTGAFHNSADKYMYKKDTEELADALNDCVRHVFYVMDQDLCSDHYFDSQPPQIDVSGVSIGFSDKIKYTEKEVHRGIGGLDSGITRRMDQDPKELTDVPSRDEMIKIKSLVLGEFRPSTSDKPQKIGTITLYNAAIAEFCVANDLDYNTVFWGTMARESSHGFHYNTFRKAGRQFRWNSGSTRNNRVIVKDSLAAGFEAVFLLNHEGDDLDLAESRRLRNHLENTWREYDIEDYSYSGALGFEQWRPVMNVPQIYQELLSRSIYDWKTAADIIKTRYYMVDPVINDYL